MCSASTARNHGYTPLIQYYELDGSEHVLELSVADVNSIMASLIRMHEADAPEVAEWYRKLTGSQSPFFPGHS